ncbi:MFS transporter [Draconibacterium orientale]|uniref:MFS transporter n=1 Tax=Draconibacterium orientale TaxID=1168034 RepID=UPI002A0A87B8|nr:MFS transporter [Draconibacterium orientale]
MNKIRTSLLFNTSCLALVVTALSFGTRGGFITPWMEEFNLAGAEVGWIVGTAFWGFTLAMVIFGPLVDILGIGKVMAIAFACHIIGLTWTIFAQGFWSLFFSTMFIGIANGSVEAAANPLVTALYPNNKTAKLNRFHMWFPAGIVIGGLIVFFLNEIGIGWRIQTAVMLVPTLVYGILFFGQKFPKTERVTVGASYKDMLKACVSPLFLFMAFCMLFTAATELGTNQWIAALFNNSVSNLFGEGIGAILILVWISAIMALARLVAGPVVHRLSGIGVLLFSAVFSGIGLYLMSISSGAVLFASATVFALGIGFFWPNMLGVVAEKVPTSGALGLAIMGGIGFLGGAIAQPVLGKIYDVQITKYGDDLVAGAVTLQYVILLTAFLSLAFLYLFLKHRKKNIVEA